MCSQSPEENRVKDHSLIAKTLDHLLLLLPATAQDAMLDLVRGEGIEKMK